MILSRQCQYTVRLFGIHGACTLTTIEAAIPFAINIAMVGRPAGSELTARLDILVGRTAAINLRIYLHCIGVWIGACGGFFFIG